MNQLRRAMLMAAINLRTASDPDREVRGQVGSGS
jgi:hypothetical protein